MIIVEGPDGSGKSTLIKNLDLVPRRLKSIRGGLGGVKADGTGDGTAGWGGTDPALKAYARKVLQYEPESLMAFDRFHLSEVVYGPILRGHQEMTEGDLALLSSFLRHRHIQVVLCLPPFEVTLANVNQNGRERPSYQTEGFLHQAYVAFTRLTPWATTVYDFTRDAFPVMHT